MFNCGQVADKQFLSKELARLNPDELVKLATKQLCLVNGKDSWAENLDFLKVGRSPGVSPHCLWITTVRRGRARATELAIDRVGQDVCCQEGFSDSGVIVPTGRCAAAL